MALTLRRVKGGALTHNELDDNFEYLDNRIKTKANETHTHGISTITGLQAALDNKIDEGDVNVPNGLLQLGADGKVPCEFLKDCFGVADKANTSDLIENGKIKASLLPSSSCDCQQIEANITALQNAMTTKVNHDDLFDNTGKVKAELLPDDGCNCQQMMTDIQNLQSQKANWLRNVRWVNQNDILSTDEDIIFLNTGIEHFSLDVNGLSPNRVIKLVRIDSIVMHLEAPVRFLNGQTTSDWDISLPNSLELVFTENHWYQIG